MNLTEPLDANHSITENDKGEIFIDGELTLREFESAGKTYYELFDSPPQLSDSEIDELNAQEAEANQKGVDLAISEGFIEVPIWSKNVDSEEIEMKSWVMPDFEPSCTEGFFERHGMDYNIYVPSYGRAGIAPTIDMLQRFGVKNWYVAVDPSQYEEYRDAYGKERLILRDIRFRDPANVDLLTSTRRPNSMSGTAGIYNNLLAFSRSLGERKYWTLDDDFIGLAMKAYRGRYDPSIGGFNPNLDLAPGEVYDKKNYYRCSNIHEEYGFDYARFMHRIERVGNASRNHGFLGLEKFGTVFSLCVKWKFGTRVYSYYLTDNATQKQHYGAMNNDVIASLEQSKLGTPPGLFECISYNSQATQAGNGGLSDQYKALGTLEKGKILVKAHPNFVKITERYSRIHHTGDFSVNNKLKLKPIAKSTD